VEVIARHLTLYPLTLAELEELTSPRLTVSLTLASMFFGAAVTCAVVLATVQLDLRELLAFTAVAAATITGAIWTATDAAQAYRKRAALQRAVLGDGHDG
jgi:hypothetical protein